MSDAKTSYAYEDYPAGWLIKKLTFFIRWRIAYKALLVAAMCAALILLAATLDHTFVLSGKNVGLLQHPTIWTFILLQAVLPFSIDYSIINLSLFLKKNDLVEPEIDLSNYCQVLKRHISRNTNLSRISYYFLFCIGITAFAWNSYQNQAPYKFLGFDFWDSINHCWGYWVTRLYKIYLWVFFLPTIIHIQFSILITVNTILKELKSKSLLRLKPYHQDGYGGVGKIVKIVIYPFIPVLIISCFGVFGAFVIHGKIGATPIIGLLILSSLFLLTYLIPAINLRQIIIAEKKRQLTEVTQTQNSIFYSLLKNKADSLPNNIAVLNALEPVSKQIKSISNWPYLNYVVKIVGIVNTPIILNGFNHFLPIALSVVKGLKK